MMLWFKWHDGPLTGLVEQRAHAKLPSTSPPPFDSFLSCHQRADLFFLCFSGLQTRLLSFSTILTYQMLCLLLLPFSPTTFWHPRPWFPQWKWHAFNYMLGLACSMAIAHKNRSFLSNRMELLRYDPPPSGGDTWLTMLCFKLQSALGHECTWAFFNAAL